MKLRALLVDDMALARQHLVRHLVASARVDIVGQCSDGTGVLDAVRAQRPDVVFLDVQMPGADGFAAAAALRDLPAADRPFLVFVTAFGDYALQAFDAQAVDYLLKPIDPQRLAAALDRAAALVAARQAGGVAARTLRLATEDGWAIVDTTQVAWVQSRGNYLIVAAGARRLRTRMTLTALAAELDGTALLRIHRSTLVNRTRIAAVAPRFNGDQTVTLDDGTQFIASRSYRTALLAVLPPPLRAASTSAPPRGSDGGA